MQPDATQAEPPRDTLATQADSPHALVPVNGSRSDLRARPSWSESARPVTTAAEALDRTDLSRMRAFHTFGIIAAIGAILLSAFLGGDPTARTVFWVGASLLGGCNVVLLYLSTSPELYRPLPVSILWLLSNFGFLPALVYFGPFSAVVMVHMLALVFISLGRLQWPAIGTLVISIGGHLAVTIPIILGWTTDRGVLTSFYAEPRQLWVAEVLVIGFLGSGYGLGRWARSLNARALAELQQAMRVLGDKEQALAEVVDQAQRANRANEGRWTNQTVGSFKLGLVLGRGAMGEVYEAARGDGTPAAVKLLNARSTASTTLVERFHREMAVAARLESPHIVRVYELSRPDAAVPYLAMERLHGTDLATRLRAENRLPPDEIVALLDQVARGLEVARLAGVVHRDLKPHNLFFHAGATWKILDFGVSKLLGSEGTLTGEGIVGTPQYMAPEQASGGQVTHLADVYALGAITYRCLTGRAPFKGRDLSELVYQVVHAAPMRPSALGRVSLLVEDVLAIVLAKDPHRRFPSAQAFAQAFLAARRGRLAMLCG
ncbi:MAG: serine/threonine protein kinase [Deltaproteobacteria bacterium]|nr:MAG: serine/threonine protein kinase [Deltaproteobacteria bacterium]